MDYRTSLWAEDRLIFKEAPETPGPQSESKEISVEGLSDLEKVAKILAEGDETLAKEAITLQLDEVRQAFEGVENRVWQIHDEIVGSVSRFGISRAELEQIAPRAAEGTMGFLELVKKYLGLKSDESVSTSAPDAPDSSGDGGGETSKNRTDSSNVDAPTGSTLNQGSENEAPETPSPPNPPKVKPSPNNQSEDGEDSFTGRNSPNQMSNIDVLNQGESILEAIKRRDEFAEVRERLKKMKKEISEAILVRGATKTSEPPIHSDTVFLNFAGESESDITLGLSRFKHFKFFEWRPYTLHDKIPEKPISGPYVDPDMIKEGLKALGIEGGEPVKEKSPAQKQAEAARYWAAAQAIMEILDRLEKKEKNNEDDKKPDNSPDKKKRNNPENKVKTPETKDPPENSLEVMGQEDLLKYVTPANIARHIKEGTVHELLLIIDASEHSGLIKNNYGEMIKRIVADIKELQEELDKASSLSVEQIKAALSGPLAELFKQKNLPVFDVNNLNEGQARTLYEVCLLEQRVRSKNIEYRSLEGDGGQFFSTLDPEGNGRTGDCNAVAAYYASLVAASKSGRLKNSIKFLSVDGHAQVVFDLGGGKMISKNTSHVDMGAVDPNQENHHNFYDISEDQRIYGFEKDGVNIMDMNTFLLGALFEVKIKIDDYENAPDGQHLHNLRLYDHMLKHGYIGPSAIYSAFSHIQELQRRGSISKPEAQEKLGRYLDAYIAGSFGSALEIHNFKKEFGKEAAKLYAQKYSDRVLRDKKRFEDYILEPVNKGLHPSRADFGNRYRYVQAVFYFTENAEVKALAKSIFNKMDKYSDSKTT